MAAQPSQKGHQPTKQVHPPHAAKKAAGVH